MDTKVTGLTFDNVRALREVFADPIEEGILIVTATTATFTGLTPDQAVRELDRVRLRLPSRGHPRQSLHAVRRKLVALAQAE